VIREIGPKECGPKESVFYRMWKHSCDEVEAEESMITERTAPLEKRIAELEAALGVFADKIECCVDCFFEKTCGDVYPGEDNCSLPDDDRRPCRMGWVEWAIEQGRNKNRE